MQSNSDLLLLIYWFVLDKLIYITILANIWMAIQKHCLNIVYYYRIQILLLALLTLSYSAVSRIWICIYIGV